MTARKVGAGDGQAELFAEAAEAQGIGRVERAVASSCAAAGLDPRDEGAAMLAVAIARTVDVAEAKRQPYAMAPVARELRDTLDRLSLTPESRKEGGSGSAFDWLDSLDDDAGGLPLGNASHT